MNLKPLINRQKLRVDSHGHSEAEWNNPCYEIHLHKETKYEIEGKIWKVEIIVPLNSDGKVRCAKYNENSNGKGKRKIEIPRPIEKEIQKAFSDDELRVQFVEELRRELRNYPSEEEEDTQIRAALQRIGHAFGINSLDESAIIKFYQSKDVDKTYNMIVKDGDYYYKLTSNKNGIELQDWDYKQKSNNRC